MAIEIAPKAALESKPAQAHKNKVDNNNALKEDQPKGFDAALTKAKGERHANADTKDADAAAKDDNSKQSAEASANARASSGSDANSAATNSSSGQTDAAATVAVQTAQAQVAQAGTPTNGAQAQGSSTASTADSSVSPTAASALTRNPTLTGTLVGSAGQNGKQEGKQEGSLAAIEAKVDAASPASAAKASAADNTLLTQEQEDALAQTLQALGGNGKLTGRGKNDASDTNGLGSGTNALGTSTSSANAARQAQESGQFDLRKFATEQAQTGTPTPLEAQLLSGANPLAAGAEKKSQERFGLSTEVQHGDTGQSAAQSIGVGTNPADATALKDATPLPDTSYAQEVKYWFSHDVQNAQMKLDGLGEHPLEVSIRMTGNEAQVAFKTDELQTQDALGAAGDQLRDLLQSSGVVLTGVSVGGSGSQANGQNGGQDGARERAASRQGSKQAWVAPASAKPVGVGGAISGGVGRSLDLFV